MTLHGVREGSVVRLFVRGGDAIDCANASEVKAEALKLIGDARDVLVDLSGVEFVDSAGVGVDIDQRHFGGRDRIFEIVDDVATAKRS